MPERDKPDDDERDPVAVAIGRAIRRARRAMDINQEQLAEAVDVSDVSSVGRWERGESVPAPKTRKRLSQFLGVDLERISAPSQGGASMVREETAGYEADPGAAGWQFDSQLPDEELIEMVVDDRRGFHRYLALHEFTSPKLSAAAKLARLDFLERKARAAGKAFPPGFFDHFRGLVRDRAI